MEVLNFEYNFVAGLTVNKSSLFPKVKNFEYDFTEIRISLVLTANKSSLVPIMAWCRKGDEQSVT